jgi:hypothetical protein
MLVPHPRSALHFVTECIRVQEEEETALPSWVRPENVPVKAPELTGLLARHAVRSGAITSAALQVAETELTKRLECEAEQIPPALRDYATELNDDVLRLDQRIRRLIAQSQAQPRRSEDVAERQALRQRISLALTAFYVTAGAGNLSRTAELARRHVPTATADGKAQHWHVRDALLAYSKPARRLDLLATDREAVDMQIITLGTNAFLCFRHSVVAWQRLKASPGYSPSRHSSVLAQATRTGELAQWLVDAQGETDRPKGFAAALGIFRYYVGRQTIIDLRQIGQKQGFDVSDLVLPGSKRKRGGRMLAGPNQPKA